MSERPEFVQFFHALWGYDPFAWPSMLAERVAGGAWPRVLDLPTAAGKTACIEIALDVLAVQAARGSVPRLRQEPAGRPHLRRAWRKRQRCPAGRGALLGAVPPDAQGWTDLDAETVFTWPLWEFAAPPDTIRLLLALGELAAPQPDRAVLRARGVVALFRARRVKVVVTGANYKLNFSQARAV
ncbi:MAG: hypothetical protein HYY76_11730 [Acidobacteria bacterium]|nr:hypothetical protein [Acidobacteriota bacterium]